MADPSMTRRLEFQRRRLLRLNLLYARMPPGERKRRVGRIIGREHKKLRDMRKQAGPAAGIVMVVVAPKAGRPMPRRRSKPRMRSGRRY